MHEGEKIKMNKTEMRVGKEKATSERETKKGGEQNRKKTSSTMNMAREECNSQYLSVECGKKYPGL